VQGPLAGRKPGGIDFYVVRENTEGEYTALSGVTFPDTATGLPQKQPTRVPAQRPAIERGCDFPAAKAGEPGGILATLR
jgi:isocitrate/isopropylmalate dehydrogenase